MFTGKAVFSAHGRAAVIATIAAVAVTAVEPSLALAGPAPSGKGLSAATATSDATDFSACRGGGGAAAAAAFAGIVGTGLAIAAAQSRPAYYGYYGGPGYYGGDSYYYGGGSPHFRGVCVMGACPPLWPPPSPHGIPTYSTATHRPLPVTA